MAEINQEFGSATEIPDRLSDVLNAHEVHAYLNDKNLTLHFPKIFNNQDLTAIYDKVFDAFPTASAMRTASNKRVIQIASADL